MLPGDSWTIAGTTRAGDPARGFAAFDGTRPIGDIAVLEDTTHLLLSVPPDDDGDPVLRCHRAELAALKSLEWVGYLSATSVYGDAEGGWVDEATPPAPKTERGKRRLAAERSWLEFGKQTGIAVQIFRLAGIYGPGRSPFDRIRAGRAQRIDAPGQVFSRIHVDDIATVLAASMAQPDPGAIYNLGDDHPVENAEVIAYACGLLGIEPPPLVPLDEAGLSPMGRSFYEESRRVRNDRIKTDLGVTLAFPDYKTGLRAILQAEKVASGG